MPIRQSLHIGPAPVYQTGLEQIHHHGKKAVIHSSFSKKFARIILGSITFVIALGLVVLLGFATPVLAIIFYKRMKERSRKKEIANTAIPAGTQDLKVLTTENSTARESSEGQKSKFGDNHQNSDQEATNNQFSINSKSVDYSLTGITVANIDPPLYTNIVFQENQKTTGELVSLLPSTVTNSDQIQAQAQKILNSLYDLLDYRDLILDEEDIDDTNSQTFRCCCKNIVDNDQELLNNAIELRDCLKKILNNKGELTPNQINILITTPDILKNLEAKTQSYLMLNAATNFELPDQFRDTNLYKWIEELKTNLRNPENKIISENLNKLDLSNLRRRVQLIKNYLSTFKAVPTLGQIAQDFEPNQFYSSILSPHSQVFFIKVILNTNSEEVFVQLENAEDHAIICKILTNLQKILACKPTTTEKEMKYLEDNYETFDFYIRKSERLKSPFAERI